MGRGNAARCQRDMRRHGMMLVETTTVPEAGLPVSDFKAHLRLGTGFGEDSVQDAVLVSFLRAAMSAIEGRTGRILLEHDFSLRLDRFRRAGEIALPLSPVGVVGAFEIVGPEGDVTVIDPDNWRLVPDLQEPRLIMLGGALPVLPTGGHARLALTAGYGSAWTDLPSDLRQAVMLLAAHYYEYRNDTALDSGCMPFGVSALTERYRKMRLSAGGER